MSTGKDIRKLEETRIEVVRFMHELEDRLAMDEISQEAYHAAIEAKFSGRQIEDVLAFIDGEIRESGKKDEEAGTKRKQAYAAGITAAIIMLAGIIAIIYTSPGNLTGYVTYAPTIETMQLNNTYSVLSETQLSLINITSLKVSGSLEGTGATIKLRAMNAEYVVAQLTNSQAQNKTAEYTLSTDKKTYALGESVQMMMLPSAENASIYVAFGEQNTILGNLTYTPLEIGEYQLVALIALPNDIARLELNFTVASEPTAPAEENKASIAVTDAAGTGVGILAFEQACVDSCTMPETSNPVLVIDPEPGSTVTITGITSVAVKENLAPIQLETIPDMALQAGQAAIINLSEYFTDPEGDQISYDISQVQGLSSTIIGDQLSITSSIPGTYTSYVYATDANQMITSNDFRIMAGSSANDSGSAQQSTTNMTNATMNETANNATSIPTITDCNDPDPNKRPLECLNNAEYFQEQTILITDSGRNPVARVTPIGNLLIRGEVFEYNSFTPLKGDYVLGYEDSLGTRHDTIWFEGATGDLHLEGMLYEENANLEPAEGMVALRNKKGITLAWADPIVGDLHLRGNVIPFRTNVMR